jgi:phosphoglycerate dehydrogenase-like enzyme
MAQTQPKIVVLTPPGEGLPQGMDTLAADAELVVAHDGESLRDAIADAQILCVTDFRTDAIRTAWPAANALEWIHATSAGVDAILTEDVRASTIPVTNARGIFDQCIAEYVLGQIIAFCKDFIGNERLQQAHQWQHRETEPLPDYDFVVIAAPLTPDTQGLFGAAEFTAMAPGARLINIGRGPIVQTEALVNALQAGEIDGAALDVFEQEPLPADHPLWDLPSVRISAHMAGDYIGWKRALSQQFIENVHRWRAGEALHNRVDKVHGFGTAST